MDRYVVFNKDDFDEWVVRYADNPDDAVTYLEDRILDGAEVIRHQDITAAPIFHQYASMMQSLIELSDSMGLGLDTASLRRSADHFIAAAEAAEQHPHRHLPTN